jgi:cell pole-organizing protein PopZ
MSAEQAQREPTMEEILASIRRIISEEDKPAESGGDVLDLQPPAPSIPELKVAPPEAAPVPPPMPAMPPPEAKPEAPAMRAPPLPPMAKEAAPFIPPLRDIEEDLMILEQDEAPPLTPAPAYTPPPAVEAVWTQPAPAHQTETLTSAPVAQHAAGALGKLMGSMLVSTGGTLDDVVRELLKPMLKEWLDINLPSLVEAEVAKEIERIRRLAR